MAAPVKVRFAPSPTGFLHIGSARTALFNWLFARHEGGTFCLRIEDTDKERSKQEFLEEILSSLKWLGLDWDGELVFQSKRTEKYRAVADGLIAKGLAYPEDQAIRFRVPKTGKVGFDDLLHGRIEFDLEQHVSLAEDLVIFKSDGSPTYNFAVVCDDAEMGITHVIRGDDHINNTPKQIPLYAALGLTPPVFCHIPLILGEDRSRMSKRHGATSIREYLEAGFLPEALVNYLSLLGWSPGNNEEILPLEEIVRRFDLKRVLKTGAVFGRDKLEWVNGQYVRKLPVPELTGRLLPFLEKRGYAEASKDREWLERVVKLFQERIFMLSQFPDLAQFFFDEKIGYNQEALEEFRKDPRLKGAFTAYAAALEALEAFDVKTVEEKSRAFMKEQGMTGKEFIHPCRVALTGRTISPGFFDVVSLLGKKRAAERLRSAASQI
ncbi:MAG TPA: glutamate--tRNA ligase [Candidatus Eisenbacteria bacterium]|nr:glutamate--tRNA ligase [Candidatus Eisenbacteria bacterium]